MSSLWSGRIYYMFGFLFLCFGLMVVLCATTTVLVVYFLLCAEDYRWQWRAFCCAGATGFYVFLYALLHWVRSLSLSSWTGGVLYLGYSMLVGVVVFVLTGKWFSPGPFLSLFILVPFIPLHRVLSHVFLPCRIAPPPFSNFSCLSPDSRVCA